MQKFILGMTKFKNMKKYYLILTLIIFISCKKNDKLEENTTIKSLEKEKISEGWKVYSDGIIKTLIPSDWNPKKKDILFLVPINKKLNIYYAVAEFDMKVISSKNYVKEIFKQISVDTPEFVYTLRKIDFTNGNTCYLLEFYTTENNYKYKTYNVIYPKKDKLYDFCYKTINDIDSNPINQKIFYDVLVTFEHHNKKVIESEKFIVKNSLELKYEDL